MANPVLSRRSALASMAMGALGVLVPRWSGGGRLLAREVGGMDGVAGAWVDREGYLMGTLLRGRVRGRSREDGLAALEAAYGEVRRLEDLLSTWRPDTELARINRSPPELPRPVSPEVMTLLDRARRLARDTAGAFDPAVGPLVAAWGLRTGGRIPPAEELAAARDATGLHRFALDPASGRVTRAHPDAWIDSGAFGKGAGLEAAARALEEWGVDDALLDFGGQLLARGAGPEGAGWPIHVADPARRDRPVALLEVSDRSVATTGASERWTEVDGERMGHVLDPRTGRPVAAWGSVTVVAGDAVEADALSTALFVMGPDEALRWAEARPDLGVLVLSHRPGDLRARWTPATEEWLREAPGGGSIET